MALKETALAILVAAGSLADVSCSRSSSVVIASKNFTESILLGEIAAQQIERKLHVAVERKLGLGGTLLAHEALVNGQIDIYPEYTGTAAFAVLKQSIAQDPISGYMQVKDAYRQRFNLVWLPPLGFNDTFAMVVRSADAKSLKRATLSEARGRSWRLGVGYEFLTRPDGLTRLDHVYDLHWADAPTTMDLGLLYAALKRRQVDMAAANSTDGMLSDPAYATLADDENAFPPYTACFVARAETLEQHPGVRAVLTLLQNQISDDTMRDLNRQVDIEHRPMVSVVHAFLETQP